MRRITFVLVAVVMNFLVWNVHAETESNEVVQKLITACQQKNGNCITIAKQLLQETDAAIVKINTAVEGKVDKNLCPKTVSLLKMPIGVDTDPDTLLVVLHAANKEMQDPWHSACSSVREMVLNQLELKAQSAELSAKIKLAEAWEQLDFFVSMPKSEQ